MHRPGPRLHAPRANRTTVALAHGSLLEPGKAGVFHFLSLSRPISASSRSFGRRSCTKRTRFRIEIESLPKVRNRCGADTRNNKAQRQLENRISAYRRLVPSLSGAIGMVSLNRFIFKQQRRRRRRIQARSGLIPSVPKENDSLCQENGCSEGGKGSIYSVPNFSEDIWWHIHSLMPLQHSARSACVSSTFLRSWRCHPKLTFTKEALGLKQTEGQNIGVDFPNRVDHILKNHSGVGVKILKLVVPYYCNVSTCHLTSWLQKAFTGLKKSPLHCLQNIWKSTASHAQY